MRRAPYRAQPSTTDVREQYRDPWVTDAFTRWMCALPYFKKELFLLRNFFRKRLGQRYVGRTYFGKELETDPHDFVQRMILNFGFWEPNISSYVSRSLSPGDTF